jgi:hypothetical protein
LKNKPTICRYNILHVEDLNTAGNQRFSGAKSQGREDIFPLP